MDVTQATELIEKTLYPLVVPDYTAVPKVWPVICQQYPWDPAFIYGERRDALTDIGEPDEVPFGEELPDRAFVTGWKVYAKTRKIGHKVTVERELIIGMDAGGRLPSSLLNQFTGSGKRFAQKEEKYIADVFQKGTLTAGNLAIFDGSFPGETDPYPKFIYDAYPFFDTAHPIKLGDSTYANHTVSLSLSDANIETARILMEHTSAVDERGEPILNMMTHLMVPTQLEFTAARILESVLKPGTANNDRNVHQGSLQLVVWRFLTDDTDAWWLLNSDRPAVYVRDSGLPQVGAYDNRKQHHIVVEAFKYFTYAVQDWRGAYCANKAAT